MSPEQMVEWLIIIILIGLVVQDALQSPCEACKTTAQHLKSLEEIRLLAVTGKVTFEDHLNAQQAYFLPLFLFILLITVISLALRTGHGYIMLVVSLLGPLVWRTQQKHMWDKTPYNTQSYYSGFDENGLHTKDDVGNFAVTSWDKFVRFKESKHTFLLYFGPNLFRYVPKRFMNQDDQDTLRQLVKAHIQRH